MYRNFFKLRKTYKPGHPQTQAERDSRNLRTAQTLGLCALVLALFFSLLGILCSCIGFCKLNAVPSSAKSAEYGSARLANGYGFTLSVLMLFAKSALLVHFFYF